MMRFFKDQIALSIVLINDEIYFDPSKSALIYGTIQVVATKKTSVKSFKVSLLGEIRETSLEKYQMSNETAEKKRFESTTVLDIHQLVDLGHVEEGELMVPFEFMTTIQYESINSIYTNTNYIIDVELVTTTGKKYYTRKRIKLIRFLNLEPQTHLGTIYFTNFNYELIAPNKVFIGNNFKIGLHVAPNYSSKESEFWSLPITNIEAYLIQNVQYKLSYNYVNNHANKVENWSKTMSESFRFMIGDVTGSLTNEGDSHSLSVEIPLKGSYVDIKGRSKVVHPTYKTNISHYCHQLRLVIEFDNGVKCKITHPIEIYGSDVVNGSHSPPLYSTNSEDEVIGVDRGSSPPAYEVSVDSIIQR